jgi:hypothetical protein
LRSVFLDCFTLVPFHQSVKTSFAQKIAFHFFRDAANTWSTGPRPTIHPVHFVHTLLASGGLLQAFHFQDRTLFCTLLDQLIGLLALLESFAFLLVHTLLVAHEARMP